jgi:ABC-type nitrate/sulfonate/bicarbonate transport system substrate-binding protein
MGQPRARFLILGITVVTVLFVGYITTTRAGLATLDPPEKLTIARTGGIPTSFFWIADEKGYFSDEGLDVSYLDFDMGRPALDAMREGEADITASGELPIVRAILAGDKISIIAELESDSGTNIIGRKDRGVSAPADLVGKKIGVPKGTVNEFQLISLLEAHGISESRVRIIDVAFADAVDALTSGKVDAVSARQSSIAQLQRDLGDNGIPFSTDGIYTFRFLLVGSSDLITQRPKVVEKVVKALVRAEEYAHKQSEDAREITARRMNVEPDVIAEAWGRYQFSIGLSQPIFVTLEDEARWLMEREPATGKAMPNFLDHMHFDALDTVKPGSVTIPH